jgi:hypothetical protein
VHLSDEAHEAAGEHSSSVARHSEPAGSTTVSSGGKTITYAPGGKTVERYKQGNTRVQQTTWSKNGTNYDQTRYTEPNGNYREVDTSEHDGVKKTTTTNCKVIDKPIDQVAPRPPHYNPSSHARSAAGGVAPPSNPYEAAGQGPDANGKTVEVKTTETVQDGHHKPKTVQASTTYSQFDAGNSPHGAQNDTTAQRDGLRYDPTATHGANANGRAYTVTETTVKDGQHVNETTWGSQSTANFVNGSGKHGTVENASLLTEKNGKLTQFATSQTARGILNRSNVVDDYRQHGAQAVPGNPARTFYQKLTQGYNGPLNYYSSTVYDLQSGKSSSLTRLGDIDNSNRAGSRTVTVTDPQSGPATYTLREVSRLDGSSNPGDYRVQEQTDVVGSKAYQYSRMDYHADGTYKGFADVVNGNGVLVDQTQYERTLANAAEVQGWRGRGDGASNDAFLRDTQGDQLYKTYQANISFGDNGDPTKFSGTTAFSAANSPDTLTYVQQAPSSPTGLVGVKEQPDHLWHSSAPYATVLQQPDGATPLKYTSTDGRDSLTVHADGSITATADGITGTVPGEAYGSDLASAAQHAVQQFSRSSSSALAAALESSGHAAGDSSSSLFDPLSLVVSSNGDGTAANILGDSSSALKWFTAAAQGAGELTETQASALDALSGLGDAAGLAGGILGLSSGLQLVQSGHTLEGQVTELAGGLSLTGSALSGAAALGLIPEEAAGGPLGWIAGAFTIGSLILGLSDTPAADPSVDSQIAPLQI